MRRLFSTLIVITAIGIQAVDIYTEDDFQVEDEPYGNTDNLIDSENVQSSRDARLWWPYPWKSRSEKGEERSGNANRLARFAHYSYPQSPIVDLMLQTVALNYSPVNSNDPFDFLRDSYPLPKGFNEPLEEYDYVIVGASAAGAVMAARLTEDKPKATVLLLEAGKPEMILSDIPALTHQMQDTDYVWRYSMEHQAGVCLGSEEQRCYSPRGKALGGSSVTDYMFYSRGRPEDWNQMAADGNYGWSYDEVLEYFKKSERSELKKYKNMPYRGREGELTVENVPFKTGLVEAFLSAGRINGYETVDYVSPDQLGFGYIQTITNKGHRLSAAKAFLHQHKRRKNLHILTDAKATKIIIEPQNKRAYAVDYIKNNLKYTVRCRREIILSAGPIASPQLLMLSGIGPQDHLQTLGLPVLSNIPVGRTLFDHVAFPGVVFKLNSSNASLMEPKVATLPNLMQWLQFGDGLLTTPGGVEAVGYIRTSVSDKPELVPDIELINMGGSIASDGGAAIRKSWKISDRTYHNSFGSLTGRDTWQAIPVLLHPKSKGRLELRDVSPFSYPKIFGNFLSDQRDISALKEAIKLLINLGESEPFRKYRPALHLAPYPTCTGQPLGSDTYWECAIRTMLVSMRRHTSTCKMGPQGDGEAVVDPELRVRGVEGLRVADASVLPKTISGHTIAPEIMIGEKAADMIRKTWSNLIA